MIEIELLEIAGLVSALKALHLPFGKECDSKISANCFNIGNAVWTTTFTTMSEHDKELLSKLVKAGDEHAKVLRGVNVWLSINAPRYWWQEMDTYRIGTERLASESTMHMQGKGLSTEELVKMKEELKEGTMQKRVQMFSYQTLRRIYFQRRHHRLPHWKEFCKFIEQLPFASDFITIEKV